MEYAYQFIKISSPMFQKWTSVLFEPVNDDRIIFFVKHTQWYFGFHSWLLTSRATKALQGSLLGFTKDQQIMRTNEGGKKAENITSCN